MTFEFENPVLVVTAHPDDECMFFAPTIIHLTHLKYDVHLLCLSNGNSEGKGIKRVEELKKSCLLLNIRSLDVIIDEELLDDINNYWSFEKIKELILEKVESYNCKTVITFDDKGVSGHKNHVSIGESIKEVSKLCDITTYSLKSLGLFRKYCVLLDIILCYCDKYSENKVIDIWNNWANFKRSVSAMLQHKSQLTWYRYIYIFTNCYMMHNKLIRL